MEIVIPLAEALKYVQVECPECGSETIVNLDDGQLSESAKKRFEERSDLGMAGCGRCAGTDTEEMRDAQSAIQKLKACRTLAHVDKLSLRISVPDTSVRRTLNLSSPDTIAEQIHLEGLEEKLKRGRQRVQKWMEKKSED